MQKVADFVWNQSFQLPDDRNERIVDGSRLSNLIGRHAIPPTGLPTFVVGPEARIGNISVLQLRRDGGREVRFYHIFD